MKQTNSLQKSYDPFANGRWYHVFLESDGTNYKITQSDISINVYQNYFNINTELYNVIDYVYKNINFVKTDTSLSRELILLSQTTKSATYLQIRLPIVNQVTDLEVYIFAERKEKK